MLLELATSKIPLTTRHDDLMDRTKDEQTHYANQFVGT